MTNREILEKVIEKAVKNGYLVPANAFNYEIDVLDDNTVTIIWDFYQMIKADDPLFEDLNSKHVNKIECEPMCCGKNKDKVYSLFDIIFNKNFAKAFWGEEDVCSLAGIELKVSHYSKNSKICYLHYDCPDICTDIKAWEYHLREMVLEEDPLKYLEKFLEELK